MPTFVDQKGMPFVAVKAECKSGKTRTTLRQQLYVYDRAEFERDDSGELWQIPVCLRVGGGSGPSQRSCHLLAQKEASLDLPGCGAWTLSNAGAEGFYRSGYDAANLRAITADVEKGVSASERIMLLGDVWASVHVGRQAVTDYLTVAESLRNETSNAVITQMLAPVEYIGQYLTSEDDRPQYAAWVRNLLAPSIQRLGLDPKAGDNEEDRDLRARVLQVAGTMGKDAAVVAWARQWTERVLASDAPFDNTIAGTAFTLAAEDGDASLYDRLLERQRGAKTPEEYYLFMAALSSFRDPKLIARSLDRTLSPEVRSQDAVFVIADIMGHAAASQQAWDFTKSRWSEIEKIFGGFAGAELVGAASVFCSSDKEAEVEQYFTAHKVPSAERGLPKTLELIRYCVDVKAQQGTALAKWLNDHETRVGQ